jgi:hypothetical protein
LCSFGGSPTLMHIDPSRCHDDSISPIVVQPVRVAGWIIRRATCNRIASELQHVYDTHACSLAKAGNAEEDPRIKTTGPETAYLF